MVPENQAWEFIRGVETMNRAILFAQRHARVFQEGEVTADGIRIALDSDQVNQGIRAITEGLCQRYSSVRLEEGKCPRKTFRWEDRRPDRKNAKKIQVSYRVLDKNVLEWAELEHYQCIFFLCNRGKEPITITGVYGEHRIETGQCLRLVAL